MGGRGATTPRSSHSPSKACRRSSPGGDLDLDGGSRWVCRSQPATSPEAHFLLFFVTLRVPGRIPPGTLLLCWKTAERDGITRTQSAGCWGSTRHRLRPHDGSQPHRYSCASPNCELRPPEGPTELRHPAQGVYVCRDHRNAPFDGTLGELDIKVTHRLNVHLQRNPSADSTSL